MDEPRPDVPRAEAAEREIEEVDALPVLDDDDASSAPLERTRPPGQIVARQAAAVAATSFAAGVATVAVVRARKVRKERRRARAMAPIVASRSFLVDVHLLGPRD
jgi:hypothetical protein